MSAWLSDSILSPSRYSQLTADFPEVSIIVNLAIILQRVDGSELRKTALPLPYRIKLRLWGREECGEETKVLYFTLPYLTLPYSTYHSHRSHRVIHHHDFYDSHYSFQSSPFFFILVPKRTLLDFYLCPTLPIIHSTLISPDCPIILGILLLPLSFTCPVALT